MKNKLEKEALEVFNECNKENWDGYNADPITKQALEFIKKVIKSLPDNIKKPDVVPEPTGNMGLEWRVKNEKILNVTMSNDSIVYIMIISKDFRMHIKELFKNELPEKLREVIIEHFGVNKGD